MQCGAVNHLAATLTLALLPPPRRSGHAARVPPPGSPLPLLPAPDLPRLLRHLRPDGSVRAGQRGRGRADEAPGGEQQGGAAGGDGGEEGAGGAAGARGGQPAPQRRVSGRRRGAERRRTWPGACARVSACADGKRAEVTMTMTAVMVSCGRCRLRMRRVPMAT